HDGCAAERSLAGSAAATSDGFGFGYVRPVRLLQPQRIHPPGSASTAIPVAAAEQREAAFGGEAVVKPDREVYLIHRVV
ncbi:hypothetical protein AL066_31895, partial [Pseudomonas nunensis]